MNRKKISRLGMTLVALLLFISGCSSNNAGNPTTELEEITTVQGESLSSTGTIVLKINPEIAIEYNEEGLVTEVFGKNDDGQKIVDTYKDFIGKDSGLVLEELIALIDEAGYFVEEVEGESRRIVLELETGSVLPEDNFLEVLTTNVQKAVSNLKTDADVVEAKAPVQNESPEVVEPELKVEENKADKPVEQPKAENKVEKPKAQAPSKKEVHQTKYIGMARAKKIALSHAGKTGAQVHWDDAEFDIDDGVPHYELEFDVGENEYEYDIHAVSGKIIKFEQDIEQKQARQNTKAEVPAEKQPTVTKEISKDEAINIALNHAGLTRAQVVFDDVELEYEDGRKEWEIEFDHGNWEYEYEIDASNGNILDYEKEYDD